MSDFFDADRRILEGEFQTNWDLNDGIVEYEGVPFSQPTNASWLRFTIVNGESNRITCGDSALYRSMNIIVVQIFVLKDKGARLVTTLADRVADIFRDQEYTTGSGGVITCYTPSLRMVGTDGKGFYQGNVSIPYKRDLYI